MSSETPADPPKPDSKHTESIAVPPNVATAEVEYDDFGLPIRKPRARTPVVDSSDSEETFEDALASKSATRENLALPEESKVASGEGGIKPDEDVQGKANAREIAQAQANGFVKSRVQKIEQKDEHKDKSDKPADPKADEGGKPAEPKENTMDNLPKPESEPGQDTAGSAETPVDATVHVAVVETSPETPETKQHAPEDNEKLEPAQERHSMEPMKSPTHRQQQSVASVSEYSHQHAVVQPPKKEEEAKEDDGWQTMPAYARYDMYDDDDRLIAKENLEELEDMHGYANVGGAAKGYTRVIMDDDADSVTSMDDNTAYLFKDKEKSTAMDDDEDVTRDPLAQMQTTKNLLTEGQRVAYVGIVRLAMVEMERKFIKLDRNKNTKKILALSQETTKMWAQKMMVRLYGHMDITTSEQVMIEQLSEHGVVPADLTPALMQNARVRNPVAEEVDTEVDPESARPSMSSPMPDSKDAKRESSSTLSLTDQRHSVPPPAYEQREGGFEYPEVKSPSQLPDSKNLDIDLRWTVMCDLFLVLITDGIYDSRSRELFEKVGKYLSVDWLEICRFEKRVTDALEMQEQADKENWNEEDHMKSRAKRARNRRLAFMGIATVGGGLVIGLSAGLLAPLIGGGLAAGFATIGVGGTSTFLAGAGGAAVITTTGAVTGSTIGVRAANRRTGNVKTFEYRPLHNNKRTNLIITLAGWMNGKVDDVRLPYSTVDPVMGDIYSVLWEPDMLRSMGDTINILATEVSACMLLWLDDYIDEQLGSHTRSPTSFGQYCSLCPHDRYDSPTCVDEALLLDR
jgi:hypothetical protein